MEQLLLLLGDGLRRVQGASVVGVVDCCGLEGALKGAHHISFFTRNRDDAATPRHLEDVVAVVGHRHEFGQCRISEDGIVRQADVGDVEVNELGAVVVTLAKGDGKADLPYQGGGAVGHS